MWFGFIWQCPCTVAAPFQLPSNPARHSGDYRAEINFPLKCRHVNPSFKIDACLTILWPMLPSHGTKQLPSGCIPKLTCTCFLAPASHRPDAAENPTDQLHMAGRTRETTRLRSNRTRGNGFKLKDSRFRC